MSKLPARAAYCNINLNFRIDSISKGGERMSKPVVNYDECTGCATCVELCPEVFEMEANEKAIVKAEDKCDSCDCEEAVDTCPSEAITME